MKELLPANAGKKIEILLEEQPAGFVQKLTVTARRPAREAAQFSPWTGTARQSVQGMPAYEVSLSQYRQRGPFAPPDLFALSNFTLTVRQDGRAVVYSGCEWTQLKQVVEPAGVWFDTMELTARARTEGSA